MGKNMIELGDKVRDRISGFEGVAVCRHSYLTGCARISVQPGVDKDGKLPDLQSFDEPQLEVVESKPVTEVAAEERGGPERYPDHRRV